MWTCQIENLLESPTSTVEHHPDHTFIEFPFVISATKFTLPRWNWLVIPAQETFKRYTSRKMKGVMQCNPKFDYFFLGHVTSVISWPTLLDCPTSIFNHLHNKIVSAQRNTYSIQILYTVPPNNCFLEGNFYLCVENAMRILDPFFFISSHCVGLLFTESICDVVSATKRSALKIKFKF